MDPADRAAFDLVTGKCGKCHPASYVLDGLKNGKTPITGQPFNRNEIRRQVVRCTRLPHSAISKEQAREILAFLTEARGRLSR